MFTGSSKGGVFVSTDTGKFWNPVGSEIPPVTSNSIAALTAIDRYLYAATDLESIQQFPIDNLSVRSVIDGFRAPAFISFIVNRSSEPILNVQYNLSAPGLVKFQITDLFGRVKYEYIQRNVPAGNHFIAQNVKTLSAGLYCVRILTSNSVYSRTFVVN